MQRLTSTNRPSDEHRNFVIDIPPPLQDKRSPGKHVLRFRSIDRWIHIIPLFVLICLFILWWFSHPVNVEIKDGKIIAIHRIMIPHHYNRTDDFDFTILASATPQNASVPGTLTLESETEPVSPTNEDLLHQQESTSSSGFI